MKGTLTFQQLISLHLITMCAPLSRCAHAIHIDTKRITSKCMFVEESDSRAVQCYHNVLHLQPAPAYMPCMSEMLLAVSPEANVPTVLSLQTLLVG